MWCWHFIIFTGALRNIGFEKGVSALGSERKRKCIFIELKPNPRSYLELHCARINSRVSKGRKNPKNVHL